MISKDYQAIIKAAKAGGEAARSYFGKSLKIEGKSRSSDFRTKADLESEEVIIKILSKKFPEYNIVSEEAGRIDKGSEYTFIIDPLDGTNNFVLGIPYFSISIGLAKGSETIFGVVYNPILNNMYFAEKGKGAFLNGRKISVNGEVEIRKSTVSVVVSYGDEEGQKNIVSDLYMKKDIKRALTNWSVLLDFCLLASGKVEAVMVAQPIPVHDFLSGKLIAKEAGAMVTDFNGHAEKNDENSIFLTSNGTKIHKEILEIFN